MKRLLAAFALISASAFGWQNEIVINGQELVPGNYASAAFGGGAKAISLGGQYNRTVAEGVQLGIAPALAIADTTTSKSTTVFTVVGGPTFSGPINAEGTSTVFLALAIGVGALPGSTQFLMRSDIGVRVPVFEHLSWRPSVSGFKTNKSDLFIQIVPLAFSILF